MDEIYFDIVKSRVEDYKVVDIYINGWNLIERLHAIELPFAANEGNPSLAGAYEGLPPLMVLPPNKHFWGQGNKDYTLQDGRTVLYEYAYSGVPGEWSFAVKIEVDSEGVSWDAFGNPKRNSWFYGVLGNYQFDLAQYRDALKDAKNRSY
ncbi:MAG: hypothetical protein AAFO07_15750 [Bacteroidota bacterium]